jgi:membrane protein DedA with SNARE-associated domain
MNSNIVHNVLNVAIALIAVLSLPEVMAFIPANIALPLVGALATAKTIINVIRDGLGGLVKTQPPVQ